MLKRASLAIIFVSVALLFLFISIFRTARPRYSFKLAPTPAPQTASEININYNLPATGYIGPESPFWALEVMRDKLWLAVTRNPIKKAEILLLLSDKRLSSAMELAEKGKYNEATPVVIKSEMYLIQSLDQLEKASGEGYEVLGFAGHLSLASLKHREILEEFLTQAPEDAKPIIIKTLDNAKLVYESIMHLSQEHGRTLPPNPFEENQN